MTTTPRKACVVMLLFIAVDAIALLAPFAASAPPDASVHDPAEPKFAAHFSGQVLGPDGEPLGGARVYLVPYDRASNGASSDAGPTRAKTDANGRFEFDAPDMTFIDFDGLPSRRPGLLSARAPGCALDWTQTWGQTLPARGINAYPVKGADLTLELVRDDVPIHGLLLDPDGRPVLGARVELASLKIPRRRNLDDYLARVARSMAEGAIGVERTLDRPHLVPGLTTEARTDLDGRFTFTGLGCERLARLKVSSPGFVDIAVTVMTRAAPAVRIREDSPVRDNPEYITHGADFTLKLRRGLTITGVVRDRDSQEPIPGMWVGTGWKPLASLLSGESSPVSDASGRFTITGLDPGLFEWDKSAREAIAVSAPGLPYQTASVEFDRDGQVVIECARGIPYRLKLLDEQGQPVEAEVTYYDIRPNPSNRIGDRGIRDLNWPVGRAAHRGEGIYEGFVLPGPGAVLVKTPDSSGYRSAHVAPKAFFAPGRTDWPKPQQRSVYGTQDLLSVYGVVDSYLMQHRYTAIVLVNPAADSGPLELAATANRDRPRRVSLNDAEGLPVVNVETQGMTIARDLEPPLRSASFFVTNLDPDRGRRITFFQEGRQLIGFLLARGDGDAPYTVRMQPWAAVTGRVVDEEGNALPADAPPTLSMGNDSAGTFTNADPDVGVHSDVRSGPDGRFRVDRLVPGQRYTAKIFRGTGTFAGMAFENLVVGPGETRDLGDIRTKPPVDVRGK